MRQDIDPGEGYRLLTPEDVRMDGDQITFSGGSNWHDVFVTHGNVLYRDCNFPDRAYRRKITNDKPAPVSVDHNPITKPKHYTTHPSGVECIQVTEHMNFCRGNAMKYLWRAGEKDDVIQDLKKAVWYIQREIERIEKEKK